MSLLWIYKQADLLLVQHDINEFNSEIAFSTVDIDKKVDIFSEINLNIFSNYCPSKTIISSD